jgi:hypothetical protein
MKMTLFNHVKCRNSIIFYSNSIKQSICFIFILLKLVTQLNSHLQSL